MSRKANPRSADSAQRQAWAAQCAEFVRSIGIPVTFVEQPAGGFLPHVRVCQGGLRVDPAHAYPGDILHEAAHVAVVPAKFRALADGDLREVNRAMQEWLETHGDGLSTYPEDPLCRAILQADEQEATAWQFAAAQHIGLPDRWLFPPGSYEGNGPELLQQLKGNAHMGIHGLQAANWTAVRASSAMGRPVFPKLARWLAP